MNYNDIFIILTLLNSLYQMKKYIFVLEYLRTNNNPEL